MRNLYRTACLMAVMLALGLGDAWSQSSSSSVYGIQRTGARSVAAPSRAHLGAGVGLWNVSPEGTIRADSGILRGTKVDVEDDLGLDDDNVLELRGWLKLGRHRIQAGYMDLGFSGSSVLDNTIVFDGQRFPVSQRVNSSVDIMAIELVDEISLMPSSIQSIDAGVILGGDYYDLDASLTAPNLVRGTASGDAIAPKIGLFGRGALGVRWIRWNVEAAGSKFDISDADVTYLTLRGDLGLALGQFATVWVGYRHLDADVTIDDFSADLTLSGPQAMVELQF